MRILSVGIVRASEDSCNNAVGRRDGYRFVRGRKPTLGAGVLCYAVTSFWSHYSTARTLAFEALAHAPGSRRCCMNTLCRWGGVARTSLDPPQEPHYGNEVEGSSHV